MLSPDRVDTLPAVRRVAVVANARSGTQQALTERDALVAAFTRHGVAVDLVDVADAPALRALARGAGPQRVDVVVAAGGDGTINTVANALAGSSRTLGIVPFGTFNYVARRYGLPDTPEAAAEAIVTGRTIAIDAGEAGGRLFLNNCSLGLYTSIVEARERHQRAFGRSRLVALLSALATMLGRHARPRVRIEHAGQARTLRASMVFVGANPLQLDGIDPEVAREVGQGALAIVVVRAVDARRLLRFAWRALTGRMVDAPEIDAVVVREASISPIRRPRMQAVVDGELMGLSGPLVLRARPGVLRLRVPAPPPDGGPAS